MTITGRGNYSGQLIYSYQIIQARPTVNPVVENRTFYIGENAQDIQISISEGDTEGTITFESLELLEKADNNYELTWTFTPTDEQNYSTLTGTYTIKAYIKVMVEFDDQQFEDLIDNANISFDVNVFTVVDQTKAALDKTLYDLVYTYLDADQEVDEVNISGSYKIEVSLKNKDKYAFGQCDSSKEFHVKASTLQSEFGVEAYRAGGFEEGVELVVEEVTDKTKIKAILGDDYNLVKNIARITVIKFVKDDVEQELDDAQIYLNIKSDDLKVYALKDGTLNDITDQAKKGKIMAFEGKGTILYVERQSYMIWIIIGVSAFVAIVITVLVIELILRKRKHNKV